MGAAARRQRTGDPDVTLSAVKGTASIAPFASLRVTGTPLPYRTNAPFSQEQNRVAKTATIETSKGTIVADLFDTEVPNTVANFEKLANSEFYDGTRFHRVIKNFMIQGGDPLSKDPNNPRVGTGGPGYKIKCETHLNTHKHVAGTLSMAHAGKDTGGSQFFICHSPQPHLDRVHTVFGQVREGMNVVNDIKQNDVINSIRVS
jgi:peptidyl-prolyl cis-trans isomerase B (cyclophilin B)